MNNLKLSTCEYCFEKDLTKFKNDALDSTNSRLNYFIGVMSLNTFLQLQVHPSMFEFFSDLEKYCCASYLQINTNVTFQFSGITFMVLEDYMGEFIELSSSNGYTAKLSPYVEQDSQVVIEYLKGIIKKLEGK